jgi:hypothetical protein
VAHTCLLLPGLDLEALKRHAAGVWAPDSITDLPCMSTHTTTSLHQATTPRAAGKSTKRQPKKPSKTAPEVLAARRARAFANSINIGRCTSPDPAMIEHHQVVYDPVLMMWRLAKPGEWDMPA